MMTTIRVNTDDLVPSSASPLWKFGQVNWEIILYLRCGYYSNILAIMAIMRLLWQQFWLLWQ